MVQISILASINAWLICSVCVVAASQDNEGGATSFHCVSKALLMCQMFVDVLRVCSHDNPAVSLETPYRQLHWCYLVFVNFWLLLQPSFLCADWTMGTIPLIESIFDIRNLLTMATFLSITLLSWYSITRVSKNSKITVISLALLVFPFVPASNLFFPVGFVVAERVLYLPSMGFCLLVALGVWRLMHHSRAVSTLVKVGLAYLLLAHSAKTVVRNKDWISDAELFVSAISVNPSNGKLYNNLGHEYETSGDPHKAEILFRSATRVQPDDIGAYINLGRALRSLGRNEEAEQVYRETMHAHVYTLYCDLFIHCTVSVGVQPSC